MENEAEIFLRRVLTLLTRTGLDPRQYNIFFNSRVYLVLALTSFQFLMSTSECLFNFQGIPTLARYFETSVIFYFTVWRIPYTMLNCGKMAKILEVTKLFWPLDRLGPRYAQEIHRPVHHASLMFHSFLVLWSVCGTLFTILPFILHTGWLPWMSFGDSNGYRYVPYWLLYSLQVVSVPVIIHVVLGFDGLFFYLMAKGNSEIKSIRLAFSTSEFKRGKESAYLFREVLRQHIIVLRYIKAINDTYSKMLLNQYLCSQVGVCMSLFLLTVSGFPPPPAYLVKYFGLVCCYLCQISIYCLMGNDITYECSTVSTSIFHNSWDDGFAFENKYALITIIERAQLSDAISIGGFLDLNFESLNKLVRQSLSFLACIQAMNTKDQ